MILVSDIFQLRFGKAKEVRSLWKKGARIERKLGFEPSRCMFDLTSP